MQMAAAVSLGFVNYKMTEDSDVVGHAVSMQGHWQNGLENIEFAEDV